MTNFNQLPVLNYNDRLVKIRQGDLTRLRWEASYYKSQFEIKKRKIKRIIIICREFKGLNKKLFQRLFGKKTEKSNSNKSTKGSSGKKKGKTKDSQGHGRKTEEHLETKEEIIDLNKADKKCSCCGLEFEDLGVTSDSEIIEVKVKAHRRVIKRKNYKKTCKCEKTPTIIRPAGVPKVIPKGKFGVSFWVYVLIQKFCFHMPINRIISQLLNYGLKVSAGAVSGGLSKIGKLLVPVVQEIQKRNQAEHHWHADESRWLVFTSLKDKKGHIWYVWIFRSETTVYFKISPTRGASVVEDHYKTSYGIISADRYGAYKVLLKTGSFLIAYCWAHVRRDFLEIENSYEHFADWAKLWVEHIGLIYHINNERLKFQPDTIEFNEKQKLLQYEILKMRERFESELEQFKNEFPSARRKVLESLKRHWSGLILFVQFHWVPMDNNPAERGIRGPVQGRKSYYGSGSVASSETAAMTFSLTNTFDLWGINNHLWFTDYLQACAENNGQPPQNLKHFLPWEMSSEQLKKYGSSGIPKTYSDINKEQIKCAIEADSFLKKKSKSSKNSSKKPHHQNTENLSQKKSVKPSTG